MAVIRKRKHQQALNRERVRRYRDRQVHKGRARLDLYLDQEVADAVSRYADDLEEGLNATVKSLLLSGLRIELKIPAPDWFWQQVKAMVKNFR